MKVHVLILDSNENNEYEVNSSWYLEFKLICQLHENELMIT